MAEIDSLEIKISAEVNKANASIELLSKKLDRLSASLSGVNSRGLATLGAGVNKLANAMSNFSANTKTADFSRLARNLNSISAIDTSKFSEIASKMSQLSTAFNGFSAMPEGAQQIGEFTKNISKLGSKSVQTAIANLPILATEMRNLLRTLSTAPTVSRNTIQMTQALANLAAQGGKVGAASRSIVNGLNNTATAANRAKKSTASLAVSFGKLYAAYFLVIRGARKLWSSIENSFEYIEVLNYFDAAFGQVASNADLSAFEKMGYNSAEAYYNSFAQRAEQLTAKMSGFTVGDNGLLQATGAVSLGLDPSQLMNYQAMFGQMSSSMGVTSENALKLSQALTEIGADLASVKNMDFEDVWNDMASGLAGMSRTLDKYGVNIRNVNLQQKLNELGINANISALNQNDKALLRTIILLDNTKYAWGDLADTINQPANQLRMIQANFQNLSRTIGNLFLPIVKTVLPYINALVIAVQRLFAWLGKLIGIDISDISTSIGGVDIGGILDQTDDLSDSLGGLAANAKKARAGLRAFDELKTISMPEESKGGAGVGGIGGGLLDAAFEDAFSKYQQEWDKAFAGLENRAQELADKIEKIFEPIKKIIQDFAIGDFFQAGKDVSALVVSITDFFADAIDKVDWYGIGKKIGDFFAGIDWLAILKSVGNLFWKALSASIETWESAFDAAPIETTIITAIGLLKFTGLGSKWFDSLSSAMSASIAGKSIGIVPTIIITAIIWKISFDIGKEIGKALFPEDAEWYDNFTWTGENGFFNSLKSVLTDKQLFEETSKAIAADGMQIGMNITEEALKIISIISDWGIKIKNKIIEIGKDFFKNFQAWWNNDIAPWFTLEKWSNLINNIKIAFQTKWKEISAQWKNDITAWWNNDIAPWFTLEKWNNIMKGVVEAFEKTFKNSIKVAIEIFNKLIDWLNDKMHFEWDAVTIAGVQIIPKGSIQLFSIPHIPQYANGGFPEDGWFRASHGEYFGRFDNGQSYIANNNQIRDGISLAVQEGNQENNMLMRQEINLLQKQNEILLGILHKKFGISKNEIGEAMRTFSEEYMAANGEPAFAI